MSGGDLVPTMRLRFVERKVPKVGAKGGWAEWRVLQQWYSENIPDYMRSRNDVGEWRDVPIVGEGE